MPFNKISNSYWLIGLVGRVFANGSEDQVSIPGRFIPKTLKMVLDTSLLNTGIRYVSRVKWSNPGKGVAPSPTPRCSSYWKGSLLVALDYGRQLYLYLCIKIWFVFRLSFFKTLLSNRKFYKALKVIINFKTWVKVQGPLINTQTLMNKLGNLVF